MLTLNKYLSVKRLCSAWQNAFLTFSLHWLRFTDTVRLKIWFIDLRGTVDAPVVPLVEIQAANLLHGRLFLTPTLLAWTAHQCHSHALENFDMPQGQSLLSIWTWVGKPGDICLSTREAKVVRIWALEWAHTCIRNLPMVWKFYQQAHVGTVLTNIKKPRNRPPI